MNRSRFAVTSVVRHAGHSSASGFVRVLSRDTGVVHPRWPVPESLHRAADPNPRGGLRGARGVSAFGNRLVIANTERLFVFDPDWEIVREITHPWMGGVHGILAEEDGIWVTCTMADLLIKVDWEGRKIAEWEWRNDPSLVEAFGLRGLPRVDRKVDYRDPDASRTHVRNTVHLNAIARAREGLVLSFGRILSPSAYRRQLVARTVTRVGQAIGVTWRPASAGRKAPPAVPSGAIEGSSSAVVHLSESGRSEILFCETGTTVPNHDLYRDGDVIVYTDTNRGRLAAISLGSGTVQHEVRIPGQPSFVRGLAPLGGLRFLVGSQRPAAVYEVDLAAGAVLATYSLGGDPDESVHNIGVVPDSFASPKGA